MTEGRMDDLCVFCKRRRGDHAAVSPLNDEHWCPKPKGRGFQDDRMFVEPGNNPDSGKYRRNWDEPTPKPFAVFFPTGVTGSYPGGVQWGVRWAEAGWEPKVHEQNDEQQARSFYQYLLARYKELGREDKPELVAARIHWTVQT